MTDVGISLSIIGAVAFGGSLAWLTWEFISAPLEDRWNDFAEQTPIRDRQYIDRAANSDTPVGTFKKWPVITEEDVVAAHEGTQK